VAVQPVEAAYTQLQQQVQELAATHQTTVELQQAAEATLHKQQQALEADRQNSTPSNCNSRCLSNSTVTPAPARPILRQPGKNSRQQPLHVMRPGSSSSRPICPESMTISIASSGRLTRPTG
jgi:uncharacterized protein (DUF3084 family)